MKIPKPQSRGLPLAQVLASLSDTVRVRMLRVLEAQELLVKEVADVFQLPQSTVSRNLKVLADAGWVSSRSAGTATLYRMYRDDLDPAARELWSVVRRQLDETPEALDDSRRLAVVLADRRLDSKAFFGQVVGEWDAVRTRLFGSSFTARALLSLVPRRWTVADLGCGTGNASALLAPHVERVIAVDSSEAMLSAAKANLAGAKNVEFVAGELESLPLRKASVDAAVCMLVLHHVADPAAALRHMRRILRDDRAGGLALIVDMREHERKEYRQSMGHKHLGFAPHAMERLMRDAGFARTEVQLLPGDPEAKGPGLFAATGRMEA
jgi:ArsR family transcriptional regulator